MAKPQSSEKPPKPPALGSKAAELLKQFRREAANEIDAAHHRAAAIMTAALVEDALTECLRKFFVSEEKAKKVLEQQNGLSNFAAKIDVGAALGLFSDVVQKDLHQIRKIRNQFAHVLSPISFGSDEVKKEVAKLAYVDMLEKEGADLSLDDTEIELSIKYPIRFKYTFTCRVIAFQLWMSGVKKKRLPSPSKYIPDADDAYFSVDEISGRVV